MVPKKKGSANTKVSPSLEESNNLATLQIDQLAKMIQGYKKKINATIKMMIDMRKMFDEKLQVLERENKGLKEKANFKKRIEYTKDEKSSPDQKKGIEEERRTKTSEGDTKSSKNSVTSNSRTVC